MENDSEDFFSIGMGFVTPGVETGVSKSETINKDNKETCDKNDVCCDLKNNCKEAENSINEDKEKNEIVVETVKKDSDSAIDESENSSESYLDKDKRKKTFSLEEATIDLLVTEDINSASQKELKASANNIILTKKLVNLYKRREISENETPSITILSNMIKSGQTIHTNFSYLGYKTDSIQNVYAGVLETLNSISLSGEIGENISTLQLLGSDVINMFDNIVPSISAKIYAGDKSISEDLTKLNEYLKSESGFEYVITELFGIHCIHQDSPLGTIVDSIDLINTLVFARNAIIDLNISDKFDTAIQNIKSVTEKNDISVDFNDKLILEKVTECIYQFTKIVSESIGYFADDVSKIYDSTVDSLSKTESKK